MRWGAAEGALERDPRVTTGMGSRAYVGKVREKYKEGRNTSTSTKMGESDGRTVQFPRMLSLLDLRWTFAWGLRGWGDRPTLG